ncbi:MAG: ribosome biogenesis GTPase Der [Gammaproteobacteria bacterium]
MRPTIALVGRPNVGKSTLFNQLTRTRDALVADAPGLTRDRNYGLATLGPRQCWVIDTGGLEGEREALDKAVTEQTLVAVNAADAVVLLVDARTGLTSADENIASQLKKTGRPLLVAVNKVDGLDAAQVSAEFHRLGIAPLIAIAAVHRHGLAALTAAILARFPIGEDDAEAKRADVAGGGIRIALIGRPNVGKSTLVNRLLGEQRVVTSPEPGTTRDSISIPFERDGRRYVLADTAGVRRRSRIEETIEKFSVMKSLQAIDSAQVVVAVMDAHLGVAEQDASLLGLMLESGRALVIAVNKWDGLDQDQQRWVRRELDRRLSFVDFAERIMISALHGSGVGKLMNAVRRAHASAMIDVSTPILTCLLEQATSVHQPPLVAGRRIRLRYAHQGGNNPLTLVIHGNQTGKLPGAYKRYLMNYFREALRLSGTPVRLVFKTGENPYAGRVAGARPHDKSHGRRSGRSVKRG